MEDALFLQSAGDSCFPHQTDQTLFQNTCADAAQNVLARLTLEDDAVDTRLLEQEGQEQTRRPSADYGHLRPHDGGSTGGVPWV